VVSWCRLHTSEACILRSINGGVVQPHRDEGGKAKALNQLSVLALANPRPKATATDGEGGSRESALITTALAF
jgi:hypothetical protein